MCKNSQTSALKDMRAGTVIAHGKFSSKHRSLLQKSPIKETIFFKWTLENAHLPLAPPTSTPSSSKSCSTAILGGPFL